MGAQHDCCRVLGRGPNDYNSIVYSRTLPHCTVHVPALHLCYSMLCVLCLSCTVGALLCFTPLCPHWGQKTVIALCRYRECVKRGGFWEKETWQKSALEIIIFPKPILVPPPTPHWIFILLKHVIFCDQQGKSGKENREKRGGKKEEGVRACMHVCMHV